MEKRRAIQAPWFRRSEPQGTATASFALQDAAENARQPRDDSHTLNSSMAGANGEGEPGETMLDDHMHPSNHTDGYCANDHHSIYGK